MSWIEDTARAVSSEDVAHAATLADHSEMTYLPLSQIQLDDDQPRRYSKARYTSEEFRELVASVKVHGVLQPITVKPIQWDSKGNVLKFQVIFGERRFRAAKEAKLDSIPCIVREAGIQTTLEIQLIENVMREDFTDEELRNTYVRLVRDFNLSMRDVARRTGRNAGTISRAIAITEDPALNRAVSDNKITYTQAQELLRLEAAEREAAAKAIEDRREQGDPVDVQQLREEIQQTGAVSYVPSVATRNTQKTKPNPKEKPNIITPTQRGLKMDAALFDAMLALDKYLAYADQGTAAADQLDRIADRLHAVRFRLEKAEQKHEESKQLKIAV